MLYADAIYALEHTDGYAVPFTLSNEELTSIKLLSTSVIWGYDKDASSQPPRAKRRNHH